MFSQLAGSGTGTQQVGVAVVVNLAARWKHLMVKSPVCCCVYTISWPLEYRILHGCGRIFKGGVRSAERVKNHKAVNFNVNFSEKKNFRDLVTTLE